MSVLKRVVIKEELVKLTGNYKAALILNQMIYWSQHVRDFDLFIAEEKKRVEDPKREAKHGWFFKTAQELGEETLTYFASTSIRRYMRRLVEAGWLEERCNPKHKWDRTTQYRVHLINIQKDLHELGEQLDNYKVDLSFLTTATSDEQIDL
ncbi:hypothetical protein CR194_13030 [Salipaludibacillus keqinensis]|uniref:Uncharacterized protein n=1 Tax=Salipaludibacillus keqinensis TaxID=2045207 RepID=A0A323TBG0_9BACI|nr:hypothetical protein [Salipaludibacillus keqinensis]PYZ92588.1 hypothetical protein CR194_13030 [Salipaludibacillus keqinensis]